MVGAINPPTSGDQTFDKFVENAKYSGGKAKNLKAGEQPGGDKPPGDAGGKSGGASATLQRGQPKLANDLAAASGGTASVERKDPAKLASKAKDSDSGATAPFLSIKKEQTIPPLYLTFFGPSWFL